MIDGRTLTMALSSDLQERFVDLAKHCRTVLCCRVTPLQKSRVVKVVREKLKVMTLAIGKELLSTFLCNSKCVYPCLITSGSTGTFGLKFEDHNEMRAC